jgi:hypothetical protein
VNRLNSEARSLADHKRQGGVRCQNSSSLILFAFSPR